MSAQSTQPDSRSDSASAQLRRKAVMAVLSDSAPDTLQEALAKLGSLPAHDVIRAPETGLVMVRGRMGGTGSPFNLGEVTVTRCVVRMESGETGSSYILGRNKQHSLNAAIADALWQMPDMTATVESEVVAPLENLRLEERKQVDEETAATRVDFFTMVRGDD